MNTKQNSSRFYGVLWTSAILTLTACGGGTGSTPESVEGTQTGATRELVSNGPDGPPVADFQTEDKRASAADRKSDDDNASSATAAAQADSNPPPEATPTDNAQATEVGTGTETLEYAAQGTASRLSADTAANPLDIFVSLDGKDTWTGRLPSPNATMTDGPLRTVNAAQARARREVASMNLGAPRRPIHVRISAGQYRLTAPLVFGPQDSGVNGAPVIYRAEVPGSVTFTGGVQIGVVQPVAAAGTVVALPSPALDTANMRGGTQLFVNAQRATLARTPNAGNYWFVTKPVQLPDEPSAKTGYEAFAPPTAALAAINGLSPADRNQAVLHVMQAWSSGHHRVSSLPTPAGSVRVAPRALWPFLHFGTDQRFYLENVSSALDAPGEWLWDSSGLRYITTAADVGKQLVFELPVLEQLIQIRGSAATNEWVQDLEFRGLSFAHTRRITATGGNVDGQAGVQIGAAIEVDAARRVVIDGCTITRTGGYAVWLRNSVRDTTVSNCRMNDLGAGGIKVGLAAQPSTEVNGTGANVVHSNIVSNTGKQIPGAVGIWVGQSSDNTISNNLVANTTYTGISVGWSWSYGNSNAARNIIRNNLLVNIGMGEMSDIGGIYTLGESPGTIISGNVIHEVRPYPGYGAGAFGLYNDEASTGVTWERNIVVGTDAGGYLLHYGRNNKVRSNVLAYGDRGEVRVTVADPLLTKLDFSGNLLLPKNPSPLVAYATAPDVSYSSNRVSNRTLAGALDLAKCGSGCTISSAVLSIGKDPRNITLAGVDPETAAWVTQVASNSGPIGLAANMIPPVNADLPKPIAAPPVSYETDIAGTNIGGKPLNLKYLTGINPAAISVQVDPTATSGKCLRFTESLANVFRWEPVAVALLNHTGGSTTVEFSIKIDANANFLHEWRDAGINYRTGPALRIRPSGIDVAGRTVAPAPVGEWVTLRITAALGKESGTWGLQVKYSDGKIVKVDGLTNKDPSWNKMAWAGFISDAGVLSTSCIGGITADNATGS
ncbi:MAG: hypothetical protein CL725_08775 [Chloroflexi bacterium]|nr:hypothetical protein [Chloroflexota bacterium]|tara:strand:- start:20071 stop:23088 length:3018 start_codon:yes stop_codon:yes gene_type:complete